MPESFDSVSCTASMSWQVASMSWQVATMSWQVASKIICIASTHLERIGAGSASMHSMSMLVQCECCWRQAVLTGVIAAEA